MTWRRSIQARFKHFHFGAFVTALKAANERVRTLTATRKASDEAYRLLVKFVNAYALIEGDSKYLSFIDYVNTEINDLTQIGH